MNKEEALKHSKGFNGRLVDDYIKWLYDEHGGVIANKEEYKKINGMTVMAQIHGMNPFDKEKK